MFNLSVLTVFFETLNKLNKLCINLKDDINTGYLCKTIQ